MILESSRDEVSAMPVHYQYSELRDVQKKFGPGAPHEMEMSHKRWGADLPSFLMGVEEVKNELVEFELLFERMKAEGVLHAIRLRGFLLREGILTFRDLRYLFERGSVRNVRGIGSTMESLCSEILSRREVS